MAISRIGISKTHSKWSLLQIFQAVDLIGLLGRSASAISGAGAAGWIEEGDKMGVSAFSYREFGIFSAIAGAACAALSSALSPDGFSWCAVAFGALSGAVGPGLGAAIDQAGAQACKDPNKSAACAAAGTAAGTAGNAAGSRGGGNAGGRMGGGAAANQAQNYMNAANNAQGGPQKK